jgi:hypothetical protein
LLINEGDGNFREVDGAGGASGGVHGVGDSVTVVDMDRDGFLDLFVANGGSMGRSYGIAAESGDYRLYRNIGNDNNWIEIDLHGTKSNRDGIGALVHVTAGAVTQVRLQDGGVHNRGQNHQRIHFGLGSNTVIERLEVRWPSGVKQEMLDVSVNQILAIKEPAG